MAGAVLFTTVSTAFCQTAEKYKEWGKNRDGLVIVTSFSDFASIARYLVRDKGWVRYVSAGKGDPHFVPPKPSYAMMLREADLWVTTGLDLEVWSTTLLDKARNKTIMDGETGFVAAADGVNLLQKVEKADRTEGDIHLMGNPHIHTGPSNWKQIAHNITIGLKKVDPTHAEVYQQHYKEFVARVDRALFGEELVDMFGGETLSQLLHNNTLFDFLQKPYKDGHLKDKLGGWLAEALPLRDNKVIAYHKNWAYFVDTFGLKVVGYVEPKPGIPPSAKHVQKTIKTIKDQNIALLLVASYFEKSTPNMIANRTGIEAVFLPLSCGAVDGTETVFELVDYWIAQLKTAIR
jgi:ABC-type Zn uptake system ZnuABC Zn-binding protein ZnuA